MLSFSLVEIIFMVYFGINLFFSGMCLLSIKEEFGRKIQKFIWLLAFIFFGLFIMAYAILINEDE